MWLVGGFCFFPFQSNFFHDYYQKQFGYDNLYSFYLGRNMYNRSVVGWNGHTKNGETLTSAEGK